MLHAARCTLYERRQGTWSRPEHPGLQLELYSAVEQMKQWQKIAEKHMRENDRLYEEKVCACGPEGLSTWACVRACVRARVARPKCIAPPPGVLWPRGLAPSAARPPPEWVKVVRHWAADSDLDALRSSQRTALARWKRSSRSCRPARIPKSACLLLAAMCMNDCRAVRCGRCTRRWCIVVGRKGMSVASSHPLFRTDVLIAHGFKR